MTMAIEQGINYRYKDTVVMDIDIQDGMIRRMGGKFVVNK
jgi:hypothetical protein